MLCTVGCAEVVTDIGAHGAGPNAEECGFEVAENRYICLGCFTYYTVGHACQTGGRQIGVRFELPETGDVRVPVEYTENRPGLPAVALTLASPAQARRSPAPLSPVPGREM